MRQKPSRSATSELGEYIRSFRIAQDLTQRQLADRLHISPAALSRLESGDSRPSEETRTRLEQIIHLPPDIGRPRATAPAFDLLHHPDSQWVSLQNLLDRYKGSRLAIAEAFLLGELRAHDETWIHLILNPTIMDAAKFRVLRSLRKKR
jgi:transcriptional regulator with XRE-family HTH domain